jgi:hypothetical protein
MQHTRRLLVPALVHLDASHLLSNLASAVPNCLALEGDTAASSALFAAELIALTAAAHGTYGTCVRPVVCTTCKCVSGSTCSG